MWTPTEWILGIYDLQETLAQRWRQFSYVWKWKFGDRLHPLYLLQQATPFKAVTDVSALELLCARGDACPSPFQPEKRNEKKRRKLNIVHLFADCVTNCTVKTNTRLKYIDRKVQRKHHRLEILRCIVDSHQQCLQWGTANRSCHWLRRSHLTLCAPWMPITSANKVNSILILKTCSNPNTQQTS